MKNFHNREECCIKYVKSVGDFIEEIQKIKKAIALNNAKAMMDFETNHPKELFFRGFEAPADIIMPSVMRDENLKLYSHESFFYREIIRSAPKDFVDLNTHIEKLAKMHHYNCPTRLLHLSQNAIVSLYLACHSGDDDGEVAVFAVNKERVKYYDSDTVAILSSFAFLPQEMQQQVIVSLNKYPKYPDISTIEKDSLRKFLHEIKGDKNHFTASFFFNHDELMNPFVVLTKQNNPRIEKQRGCMIIPGLQTDRDEISANINHMRYKHGTYRIFIDKNFKGKILKELKAIGINEATLFPELDHVCSYVKNEYKLDNDVQKISSVTQTKNQPLYAKKDEMANSGNNVSPCMKVHYIENVKGFIEEVVSIKGNQKNNEFFYRGIENKEFSVLPFIMRYSNGYLNESEIYHEIIRRRPTDFSNLNTHIEKLAEIQHYGACTRLLDITENPLVALYFACLNNDDATEDGEVIVFSVDKKRIKNFDSDTVSIVASFGFLTNQEQKNIIKTLTSEKNSSDSYFSGKYKKCIKKLLNEVKNEKPYFDREFIKKGKELKIPIVVLNKIENPRIENQMACFIIPGLDNDINNIQDEIKKMQYKENNVEHRFIVRAEHKEQILEQLDIMGINQATLFPELEAICQYIAEQNN